MQDTSVHIVLCMEVLDYLNEESKAAAVKDMARVLAAGGHLLIGTTLGDSVR